MSSLTRIRELEAINAQITRHRDRLGAENRELRKVVERIAANYTMLEESRQLARDTLDRLKKNECVVDGSESRVDWDGWWS